jgi:hypothetical protein
VRSASKSRDVPFADLVKGIAQGRADLLKTFSQKVKHVASCVGWRKITNALTDILKKLGVLGVSPAIRTFRRVPQQFTRLCQHGYLQTFSPAPQYQNKVSTTLGSNYGYSVILIARTDFPIQLLEWLGAKKTNRPTL